MVRHAGSRWDLNLCQYTVGGQSSDFVGSIAREPDRAVSSGGNTNGNHAGGIKLGDLAICADAPDLVRISHGEPDGLIRPHGQTQGLAVFWQGILVQFAIEGNP